MTRGGESVFMRAGVAWYRLVSPDVTVATK